MLGLFDLYMIFYYTINFFYFDVDILVLICANFFIDSNKATKLIPTKLFATPDGTIYFVANYENGRTRILWSFSTGSPTYSSYQAPGATDFLECEDDWSLYMQDEYYGKLVYVRIL